MIARHMKNASDKDFENFDYFNDFKDTHLWLLGVQEGSVGPESERIGAIIARLQKGFDDYTTGRHTPKMSPFPNYGDLMTLEAFLENVRCGGFIDYDGHGYYASATEMSDKMVVPSDVTKGVSGRAIIDESKVDRSFTHVMWFNR